MNISAKFGSNLFSGFREDENMKSLQMTHFANSEILYHLKGILFKINPKTANDKKIAIINLCL
jgi:hypothetical protein